MELVMYDLNEIIALVVNTAMGTAAYVGFQVNVKRKKVTIAFVVWTFFISLFFSNLISNSLVAWEKEEWRSSGIACASFLATYVMQFIDQDSGSIFKKIVDALIHFYLGKSDNNNNYNNYNDEFYEPYKKDDDEVSGNLD